MLRWWSGLTHQSRKLEQAILPVVGSNPTLSAKNFFVGCGLSLGTVLIDNFYKTCYYNLSFMQLFFKRMIGELMDYKLIVARNDWYNKAQTELEEKVQEHIVKGWEPLGGVSISMERLPYGSVVIFTQAMIRKW